MTENEIKPVAFDGSELRHGCVQRPKRWSGDTHDDLGGSVDEAATDALMAAAADAIDRLTAERDAAESQRNGYMEQHCRDSAELRAVCAERDKAQRKLSVAVANGNALAAQQDVTSTELTRVKASIGAIHYAIRAGFSQETILAECMNAAPELAAIDAARAEGGV